MRLVLALQKMGWRDQAKLPMGLCDLRKAIIPRLTLDLSWQYNVQDSLLYSQRNQ